MEKEIINDLKKRKRTLSRMVSAQILYQYYFFEEKREIQDVKYDLLENYTLFENEEESPYHDKVDNSLIDSLTQGVLKNYEALDAQITELKNSTQEVEDLLNQILRLSAYELAFNKETPVAVIIDEYVDIAALFFDDSKVSFVNSIIENLAKKYERK